MHNSRKNKYMFTLTGVDTDKVNKKYGINLVSNIIETQDEIPSNTTKLCELNKNEIISFLDESKRSRSCQISMIDFKSQQNVNLLSLYDCYWCRHPFTTNSIGCPIRYISNRATKKYYSEISKDVYTIKENITTKRKKNISDQKNISVNMEKYYETDGIFCSFNCCKAFIDDNKHIRRYDLSTILLTKMYNEMLGTKTVNIMSSPHWRLLKNYGGHLTISKFRENFSKIKYENNGIIKNNPNFLPIGIIFEEKIKF